MWLYFVCNLFKCYLGVNMGVSLIRIGADMVITGLKLLLV